VSEFMDGIIKIAVGGFICIVFGQLLIRSLWDRETRATFLSSPHVWHPTRLHKVGFALLALLLVAFAVMLIWAGGSQLLA